MRAAPAKDRRDQARSACASRQGEVDPPPVEPPEAGGVAGGLYFGAECVSFFCSARSALIFLSTSCRTCHCSGCERICALTSSNDCCFPGLTAPSGLIRKKQSGLHLPGRL